MRRATISKPDLVLIGPIKVKEELLWNTRRVRVEVGRVLIPLSIGRKRKIDLKHACIRILDPRQFLLGTHKDTIQFRADTPADCQEWVEALVAAKKKAGLELNEFDDVDFADVQRRKQAMSSEEVKEQLRKFRRKVTILSVRYNSPPGSATAQKGRQDGFPPHPLSDSSVIDEEEDLEELASSTEEESEESDDEAAIEAFRRKYGGVHQAPAAGEISAGSSDVTVAQATATATTTNTTTATTTTPQRRASSARTNIGATSSSTAKAAAASARRRRSTHSASSAAAAIGTSTTTTPQVPKQESSSFTAAAKKTPVKDNNTKRTVLSSTVLAAAERSAAKLNSSVWRRAFDQERKRYYYYNKRTKETSWKCPPDYIEAEPSASASTATEPRLASTTTQPKARGSPKNKNQSAANQSAAAAPRASSLQSVALAKKAVNNTLSPSVRAAARASKSKASTNNPKSAGTGKHPGTSGSSATTGKKDARGTGTTTAAATTASAAAATTSLLPRVSRKISHDKKSGWARIWDDKKLRYYYHNKATNETVWSVPLDSIWSRAAGGLPSAAAAAPGRIRSKKSGGGMLMMRPTASVTATKTSNAAAAAALSHPPPNRNNHSSSGVKSASAGTGDDVWLEFYDSARNRPYFYNKATKKTVWKRPTSGQIVKPTVRSKAATTRSK